MTLASCIRRLGTLALVLATAIQPATAQTASTTDPLPPLPPSQGDEAAEQRVLDDSNRARAAAGLPPLRADPRLRAAARLHAQDMIERGFYSHTSDKPGHENPTRRIHRAGALDFGAAENIARLGPGFGTERLVPLWMDSPGHRANILNPAYTHLGAGVVLAPDGRAFGVQKFVDRRLEPMLTLSRGVAVLERVQLTGRAEPGLQLALFAGPRYLGRVATDAQGGFVRELDFSAGQTLQLGWRREGDAGAFLTQATLRLPAVFEDGELPVQVQAGAPLQLQGRLAGRREEQHRLTLQLPDAPTATEGASLIEHDTRDERRTPFADGRASVACPLDGGRRVVTLVLRGRVESRFGFDCASGRVEPGAER